jgi:hypothetical protein
MKGNEWQRRAHAPLDASALVAFRVLFGLVQFAGCVRFLAAGWVEDFFVAPSFFFHFWFARGVSVGPPWVMYSAVCMLAVLSLCIAAGWYYRYATVGFLALFVYVELIDVTNYLNHYYLVSLVALLLTILPLHRAGSLDARRRPEIEVQSFPAWMTWLLRFQVGLVYVFAAIAKANEDWLLHAQPLEIWLSARTETPWIGGLVGAPFAGIVMSWAGFLFDLCIVPALLWAKTRRAAFAGLVLFHVSVGLLFNIGMFPFIMVCCATVFLAPDWPRRLGRKGDGRVRSLPPLESWRLSRWAVVLLALWVGFHVMTPLRGVVHPGAMTWHEQGMRFSWRVMVREKNGSVTYRVRSDRWTREREVTPARYLTSYQEREMSGQPDLIVQLAKHIGEDLEQKGHRDVEVRADALVAWNGRPPAPLIDPEMDLLSVEDDPWETADWILSQPSNSPRRRGFAP